MHNLLELKIVAELQEDVRTHGLVQGARDLFERLTKFLTAKGAIA